MIINNHRVMYFVLINTHLIKQMKLHLFCFIFPDRIFIIHLFITIILYISKENKSIDSSDTWQIIDSLSEKLYLYINSSKHLSFL